MDYKFTSKKYSDRLSNIISIYSGSYMLHPLILGAVQINLTTSTTDGTDSSPIVALEQFRQICGLCGFCMYRALVGKPLSEGVHYKRC